MDVTRRSDPLWPAIPCVPVPARSPVALLDPLPVALPVELVPEGRPAVCDPEPVVLLPPALLPDIVPPDGRVPDWFSTVPVTSTRRFTSLFISPTFPVSR